MRTESTLSVTTRFDGQNQHGSFMQHMWHRYRWWVIARSVLCLGAVALGAYLMEPGTKGGVIGGVLVMVGSFGFMRPMLWQMWQERGLRKHPAYDSELTYIFSEKGVEMQGGLGDLKVAWGDFYEVVCTKKGLLMYQDKKQYVWIAKAAFTGSQMEQVLRWWGRRAG